MMNRDTLQPDRNRKSKIKRHIYTCRWKL